MWFNLSIKIGLSLDSKWVAGCWDCVWIKCRASITVDKCRWCIEDLCDIQTDASFCYVAPRINQKRPTNTKLIPDTAKRKGLCLENSMAFFSVHLHNCESYVNVDRTEYKCSDWDFREEGYMDHILKDTGWDNTVTLVATVYNQCPLPL